jgi:hypothetical protein
VDGDGDSNVNEPRAVQAQLAVAVSPHVNVEERAFVRV